MPSAYKMSASTFIIAALTTAIVTGIVAWLVPTVGAAMRCNQTPQPGVFLAYCENSFGDYEHAAYSLDLEPHAVESLKKADVVALGSSLIQFALSTESVRRYFDQRGLHHYLFGFGYNEGGVFPLSIISRLDMNAKVYVIHAFQVFGPHISTVAEQAKGLTGLVQNVRRKAGAKIARLICKAMTCGGTAAFYRYRADGHWLWQGVLRNPIGPTAIPDAGLPKISPPTDVEKSSAARVINMLHIKPGCAIITATPRADVDQLDYAAEIARAVGATFIAPRLSGLRSIDAAHLDQESAERWSTAFLRAAADTIERCTKVSETQEKAPEALR